MNRAALAVVPGLVTALLSAQTVTTFPFDHASREGSSSITNRPLSAGVSRVQIVYSNWRLGLPNGAQIQRVGFRPDQAGTGTGHQLQLEIWMGHSDNFHTGVSTTFDNNYVAPAVRVFDRQIFSLPTVPSVSSGPQQPFWILLDRPFTYDSSHNLVVEYRIFANSNGNAAFSYRLDNATFVSNTATFGTGCQTSNNRTPAMSAQATAIGSTMSLSLSSGPASSAGVLLVGFSNTSWNGVPLPLPLAAFGAGSCSLQVAIDVNVGVTTNSSGSFSLGIPVPNVLALYGQTVYVQSALGDLFANAAGFVTSASASASLGAQPQGTMVVATGNANATTGSRTVNHGAVAVFER